MFLNSVSNNSPYITYASQKAPCEHCHKCHTVRVSDTSSPLQCLTSRLSFWHDIYLNSTASHRKQKQLSFSSENWVRLLVILDWGSNQFKHLIVHVDVLIIFTALVGVWFGSLVKRTSSFLPSIVYVYTYSLDLDSRYWQPWVWWCWRKHNFIS